jgi:hypothetical protein
MDISSISAGFGYAAPQPVRPAEGSSRPSIDELAERLVQAKDLDGSATLDGVELSISKEAFALLDANTDSQLDTTELVEGAKKMLRKMGFASAMAEPMGLARKDEDDEEQTALDRLFGNDEDEEAGIDTLL